MSENEVQKILIYPETIAYFGRDLLKGRLLLDLCKGAKVVVIADFALKEMYAEGLAKQVGAALLVVPSGEASKSQEMVARLINDLADLGCGRDTLLIAMGGGVVSDVVGFVASIYMRGVALVLIPTTLLAVIDASIGGKNGINTSFGKNLIGTIYPPKAILMSLDLLQTLSEDEKFNGLAEILKMGLIYDPLIWQDPSLILRAIEAKVAVVEKDLKEQSIRRILNFGHTIGHAIEKVAGYQISHGKAVAIGCAVEAHLSMQLGYLSKITFEEIWARFSQVGLQLPKGYTRARLIEAMAQDKKKQKGQVRFVLLDAIGHAVEFDGAYCRAVGLSELEATLTWMEEVFL